MKSTTLPALVLACAILPLGAFAQNYPAAEGGSRPQIAYRLLGSWVDENNRDSEQGNKIAAAVMAGTGGLALATAGATWLWGDRVYREVAGTSLPLDVKQGVILGAGIGGAALLVGSLVIESIPVVDQRQVYADIFRERDPELQEAMAVAALREQAERGKQRRMASFLSSLVVPVLTSGIRIGINMASGETWSKDVTANLGYSSWSTASGLVALFSKSQEELLFERYLTTRSSLYGEPLRVP